MQLLNDLLSQFCAPYNWFKDHNVKKDNRADFWMDKIVYNLFKLSYSKTKLLQLDL